MQERYAVLGWGSLIWDLDNLAPHVTGEWMMSSGPLLPMEFSRISPKRKMGLVVCLDAEVGTPCATHAIASRRSSLEQAITDLAARERAPRDMIGGLCLASGAVQGQATIADVVRDWCTRAGWQGAVWTDLRPNFAEHTGAGFALTEARAYLRTLSGENLAEAVRYIQNAPAATDTPLRRALSDDPWWRKQAERLDSHRV